MDAQAGEGGYPAPTDGGHAGTPTDAGVAGQDSSIAGGSTGIGGSPDSGAGGEDIGGAGGLPSEPVVCVFDQSLFDRGCVFGE